MRPSFRRALLLLSVPALAVSATASAATDTITTYAGPGSGANVLGTPASLSPMAGGGLLLADPAKGKIWRIGQGSIATHIPNGPDVNQPKGVTALPDGGAIVADAGSGRIRWFNAQGEQTHFEGGFTDPTDVLPMPDGRLLVANGSESQIVEIDGETGMIRALGDPGNLVGRPYDLSLDEHGDVLFADPEKHAIFKLDGDADALNANTLTVVAGTSGQAGSSGDGGAATAARLRTPEAVAATAGGGFLIAAGRGGDRLGRPEPGGRGGAPPSPDEPAWPLVPATTVRVFAFSASASPSSLKIACFSGSAKSTSPCSSSERSYGGPTRLPRISKRGDHSRLTIDLDDLRVAAVGHEEPAIRAWDGVGVGEPTLEVRLLALGVEPADAAAAGVGDGSRRQWAGR